jgi:hypothetical protein
MIDWLRKLSWKWRLTILFVIAVITLLGVIMSDDGQEWMVSKVVASYNELPESERRDSPLADRYLKLAYFRGFICGDSKNAMLMYQRFLGIVPDEKGENVFKTWKLNGGLCSPDGKTGWGPAHPRAPEAYMNYLELYEPLNSSQYTGDRCWEYYTLLYEWMIRKTGKPNENFKKYWDRVVILGRKSGRPVPANVDLGAKQAPAIAPED